MSAAEPHPCTRCGQTFYFVGPQPNGWVCRYCTPDDAARCSYCGGTGFGQRLAFEDTDDVCPWCSGSGEG